MPDAFDPYLDAAVALWELPLSRLEELRGPGQPEAFRRAAHDTLIIKAEFITPDAVRDERRALSILAASLQDDPEFTVDLALRLAGRSGIPQKISGAPTAVARVTVPSSRPRRTKILWATVVAAGFLLALEVLAAAGVRVPNPIGEIMEGMGEDSGTARRKVPERSEHSLRRDEAVPNFGMEAASDAPPSSAHSDDARTNGPKTENPNRADGKERNQKGKKEKNGKKPASDKGARPDPNGRGSRQASPGADRAAPEASVGYERSRPGRRARDRARDNGRH